MACIVEGVMPGLGVGGCGWIAAAGIDLLAGAIADQLAQRVVGVSRLDVVVGGRGAGEAVDVVQGAARDPSAAVIAVSRVDEVGMEAVCHTSELVGGRS